ncbi:Prefoldin subunit-domain-containing protein [Armillaria novae-zelandiae]|uniref:Prefoldin subunit 4 n=1 Tax=Armillaria novae-zelandiae TaxID=153914 RepID=A0AA39P3G0_9AGAR|nr:Prefoldin subunit-domain-containing protein [Armillaria novae-zelandiae]
MSSLRMVGSLPSHASESYSHFLKIPQDDENDDAAEVTWEDQQRINTFSKLNTRMRSIDEKLDELKQEKEALDDLSTELELANEDDPVLYKVGETFLHMPHPRAMKRLERDQAAIDSQVSILAAKSEACQKEMNELKVVLYAKFGRAINLDE